MKSVCASLTTLLFDAITMTPDSPNMVNQRWRMKDKWRKMICSNRTVFGSSFTLSLQLLFSKPRQKNCRKTTCKYLLASHLKKTTLLIRIILITITGFDYSTWLPRTQKHTTNIVILSILLVVLCLPTTSAQSFNISDTSAQIPSPSSNSAQTSTIPSNRADPSATLSNHEQTSNIPSSLPQTSNIPSTLPQTSFIPSTLPQTPFIPSTLPPTPNVHSTLPQTPNVPSTLPQTPNVPSTLPQTPNAPSTLPQTPNVPSTLPQTQNVPSTLPQTSNIPTTLPQTPNFPSILAETSNFRSNNPQTPTVLKLGIILPYSLEYQFSMKKVYPAIWIAAEKIKKEPYLLQSIKEIVLTETDSRCSQTYGPLAAINMVLNQEANVFFGPTCDLAVAHVALYSRRWNIPVISTGAFASDLDDKEEFGLLTRLGSTYTEFSEAFMYISEYFHWMNVGFLYDSHRCYYNLYPVFQKVTERLKRKAFNRFFERSEDRIFEQFLNDIHKEVRIIVLCASSDSVREIMIKANELNFDNGEYVFFNIDLFSSHNATARPWFRHNDTDERNAKARKAYESLMTVTLRKPTSPEYRKFSEEVKARAAIMYKNFTYGEQEVNSFVGAFHDAVILYALALNETLEAGGNVTDGLAITKRMWNRTFEGITGTVSIDANGDRNADYSLLDLNPETDMFEVVADYFGNTKLYTPVPGKRIHWAGGRDGPPPDTPLCGFDNSLCPPDKPFPEYAIVIIVLGSILLVVLIVTFFVYRHFKLEAELAEMNWRVRWDDIMFGAPTRANKKVEKQNNSHRNSYQSECSADTIAVHLSDVGNRQLFTKTGYYKGAILAVKSIPRTHISIQKPLLLEIKKMKDLQNDHLVRFHGVCIDIPNQCILTEYCPKGSLQDVLENEQIKLDWMFRYSIMQDIVRGMAYLHSTDIKSHGHIKSSNCVVDSRFVVKVTDFGLHYFREKEDELQEDTYALERSKLWTAPELQRMSNPVAGGTQKGDVYSFAIICQEIVYRFGVFYLRNLELSPKEITDKLKKGMKPYFRPTLEEFDCPNDELAKVIRHCWSEEPAERPDFQQLRTIIKKLNKDGDKGDILDNLLSRMEQYANNLEALVEERTSDYLQEKKKAEELLYNMLPKYVASKLIRGETVTAEWYEGVTIYFSDICGFTAMSAESTPMQVVDLLNDLYTCFDSIVEHFDVYKVETIGDAYMVVSGLPVRNGNLHTREIARMSLALLDAVFKFKIRHRPGDQLKLRIGLHSGPVCAGVVGLKMPRYCLFGDTVNTSSRMESNGLPLRIHVSPFTKEILDQFGTFQLESRGPVEMKGKGTIVTYWLLGEENSPYNIKQQGCNEPSQTTSPQKQVLLPSKH